MTTKEAAASFLDADTQRETTDRMSSAVGELKAMAEVDDEQVRKLVMTRPHSTTSSSVRLLVRDVMN